MIKVDDDDDVDEDDDDDDDDGDDDDDSFWCSPRQGIWGLCRHCRPRLGTLIGESSSNTWWIGE